MRIALVFFCIAALAGCATPQTSVTPGMTSDEVMQRLGRPQDMQRLPDGAAAWDYSLQPFGYAIDRVTFDPDGRVRDVRNLLTEQNFVNLRPGMTEAQVAAIVGPAAPSERREYAGGTRSWTYRYYDYGVVKLLNVIFDSSGRVLTHYTEWDPRVYSKGGSNKDSNAR